MNNKILSIIALTSFFSGIFIICFFYNVSAILKFKYLDLKNEYTNDNKYLASVTENGLWIKDEVENSILIVNASIIDGNFLRDVSIIELSKNFDLIRNIEAEKVDIKDTKWIIFNSMQHINKDNIIE